ncbi:S41 family peptidase [Flavobacterium sangjuense]|uniref:Tail-specific protease n=1 Tax=Flavobacterium sangjuense TaxID=2518177 RepID=A0A4P7PWA1_9FLAO|nr:S41 family peptidase [Flavobacterium sangjuense]QBZ98680.1 Tail-specific protease [Flavobacterium sangjuense]
MKKLLQLVLLLPLLALSQKEKNPCETLASINALIQENHYSPKPIDDSLSVYAFKTFLSRLDEENRLFIAPEINELKKHEYQIDDYINGHDCAFLHDFYAAYSKSIARYSAIIASLKNEDFPLSSDEKVVFSRKAFPYANDEAELKRLYKKRILFNVLREVAELSTNKDSLTANFEALAISNKKKVFDRYECKTESYQMSETEFNAAFYSVFCSYFDPHTEYFSENDKSEFFSTVSSDNLTFGLYVSLSEKDELTVDDIIPGSSAYFTNKISVGDQLLKIKYKKTEYETACASMKKIDEIITSKEYKTAIFTFRKKSGEIYSVRLVKKILKDYQNNVYSFRLKTDNATFGYIKIPSFYSTFENGKSSITVDVANEIYKLEDEQINGLIIDVENNGGGSMEEAVRLSGLFINDGPLAIMNNNKNNKEVIPDSILGTLYNGPMVIMINGFSASASEFFTNAMQDYNRAIVIGNKSLGKATMQRIFPINENNDEFLKLTLEKFYRLTGKSNQYDGITPDVEIPLLFDKQMPRENSYDTALKNDEIHGLKYNHIENLIYADAIAASKKRITENTDAIEIEDLNTKINPLYDADLPPVVLQFSAVFDNVNQINSLWKEIKKETEKVYPITVELNAADIKIQKKDDFMQTNTTERIKNIRQNFHILEATNILYDVNNLKP